MTKHTASTRLGHCWLRAMQPQVRALMWRTLESHGHEPASGLVDSFATLCSSALQLVACMQAVARRHGLGWAQSDCREEREVPEGPTLLRKSLYAISEKPIR